VSFRILLQSKFWNWIFIFSVVGSLLFFMCLTFLYHGITVAPSFANFFYNQPIVKPPQSRMPLSLDNYWVYIYLLKSLSIWLTTLIVTVVCLLPYLIVNSLGSTNLLNRNLGRLLKSRKTVYENDGYEPDDDSVVNIRL